MKKFIYLDGINRKGEAYSYETSDYISSYNATPGKPIKTGIDGLIDSSLLPLVPAASLQIIRKTNSIVVPGDVVKADSDTHVSLSSFDLTLDSATSLGVAITSGNIGDNIIIMILGVVTLPVFNIFTVNSILFLDSLGAISDVRPINGYLTTIGKALGGGSIMVQVGNPTKLI